MHFYYRFDYHSQVTDDPTHLHSVYSTQLNTLPHGHVHSVLVMTGTNIHQLYHREEMYTDIGSIVRHPHNPEIEDHFLEMCWYVSIILVYYFTKSYQRLIVVLLCFYLLHSHTLVLRRLYHYTTELLEAVLYITLHHKQQQCIELVLE